MARTWLVSLRESNGLSQLALARKAGIAPPERYGRIEKGYADFSPEAVAGLAAALGVSPEFISTGVHPPPRTLAPSPLPPVGLAAAKKSIPSPVAPEQVTPGSTYEGGDIADPQGFSALPPLDQLQRRERTPEAFRKDLEGQLHRARKVLHTSKIPAKIWASWRAYEKAILELLESAARSYPLHESSPRVPTNVPISPKPIASPAPPPVPPKVSNSGRTRSHVTKEFVFVATAREYLPAEEFQFYERLAADAKKTDATIGFMKHFFQIAAQKMPSTDYHRLCALADEKRSASSSTK